MSSRGATLVHCNRLQPHFRDLGRTGQVATPVFSRAEFSLRQDGSNCPPSLCTVRGLLFSFIKLHFCFYKCDYRQKHGKSQIQVLLTMKQITTLMAKKHLLTREFIFLPETPTPVNSPSAPARRSGLYSLPLSRNDDGTPPAGGYC